MSNALATQAAGLGRYAWINADALNTPIPPKPKPTTAATTTTGKTAAGTSMTATAGVAAPTKVTYC